jgi:hypothetical protein
MDIGDDSVNHLIGKCLRSKADAEWLYDMLISRDLRKIDLITGSVHLSPAEHTEFITRFSAEVEPTIWESSLR